MVIFPTGLTYSRNTKAPFETNRVFATLADMFAYLDNENQTGYLGMTVVVTSDKTSSNNGVYVVTREGSVAPNSDGTMPSHPKIGKDTDAQWANVSKLAAGASLATDVANLQTAINELKTGKVDKTTTINGKKLESNVTLGAEDIKYGTGNNTVASMITALDNQVDDLITNATTIDGKNGEITLDKDAKTNGAVNFAMSDGKEISATVYGLKSAAFTESSAYDTAGAANAVKTALIGTASDSASADTIKGAKAYADSKIADAINSAMHIKGKTSEATWTAAVADKSGAVKVGDAYVVDSVPSGSHHATIAGHVVENGDVLVCVTASTTSAVAVWTVLQNNIDEASSSKLGTVKLGTDEEITADEDTKAYSIGNDMSGKLAVAIPAADLQQASKEGHYTPATDKTVTSAGSLAKDDIIATAVSYDSKGHITAVTGKKLDVSALGGVKSISIDSTSTVALKNSSAAAVDASGNIKLTLVADAYVGADSTKAGVAGLVPAAAQGDHAKVLSGHGTWVDATSVVSEMRFDYDTGVVTPGLVPSTDEGDIESGDASKDYFLSAQGHWRKVDQVKYTLGGNLDADGCLSEILLKGSDLSQSKLTVAKVHTAAVANSTTQSLTFTQNATSKVFNGSTALSINLDQYALASDLEWIEFN